MTVDTVSTKKSKAALVLKASLYFLLLLSLGTGLLVYLGGGATLPGISSVPNTVDGELRFYGPYWIAYGFLCAWIARDLNSRLDWVVAIAAVLFLSGCGRLLSRLLIGEPASMFLPIMIFELVFPAIMLLLKLKISAEAEKKD
jgi:hypothetical protein